MPFKKLFKLKKTAYLIGIIIFILLLLHIDIKRTFSILSEVNPSYILLASILMVIMILFKAYKWRYIMKIQGIYYSLWDSFLMFFNGLFVSILTPGRIGDFVRVFYLKKEGFSTGKSFFSVIVDRISDIVFLLIFGFVGILLLSNLFYNVNPIYLLATTLIIFTIFLLYFKYYFKRMFKCFFRILIPLRYKPGFKATYSDFITELKRVSFSSYFSIVGLTILSWFLYFSLTYVLAKSIGINIPFIYMAFIVTISGLITLIPITINGIGTRDATFIFLLSFFNYSGEKAIAFSFLILGTYIFIAFFGVITWFIKPIPLNLKRITH